MLFVFRLKSPSDDADMLIPALCNGPDHARTRARELLAKHPGRRITEVSHRGRIVFQSQPSAPASPTRPAVEL